MGNSHSSISRCWCCCLKAESSKSDCRVDFCCLHIGGGRWGDQTTSDGAEVVTGRSDVDCNLCCCGWTVDEVVRRPHQPATHPDTTQAQTTGAATTKPQGAAPPYAPPNAQGNSYMAAPGPQQMQQPQAQQQYNYPPAPTAGGGGESTVVGYPAMGKGKEP